MNGGILNSITRLHLVGYFSWIILQCTDPWILNLIMHFHKLKFNLHCNSHTHPESSYVTCVIKLHDQEQNFSVLHGKTNSPSCQRLFSCWNTYWDGILNDCIFHQKSLFDSNLNQFKPFLNNPWPCTEQLDRVTKPTIAHECIKYIINTVFLPYVSALFWPSCRR
jgi:hypothetical protein